MKKQLLFPVLLLLIFGFSAHSFGQTYTLGQGGNNISTCGGTILDPGGNGDYTNSLNVTQTFCAANPGECIQLSITFFQTEQNYDFLRIYNGSTATGEPLFDFSGAATGLPITISGTLASGGCVTLAFNSDGSVTGAGFSIDITCVPCPPDPVVFILGQGPATVNTCDGILRDPGGANNYPDNANVVQTFCATNGECVRVTFTEFQTENAIDLVRFYDGPSTASALLDEASGFNLPPAVTSTTNSGGCLTIEFTSNAFFNNSGFKANISCVPCPPPPQILILGQGGATIQTCNGILSDPGGPGSYGNDLNVVQTICSATPGECIQLTFNEFSTEAQFDQLRIYDGPTTGAELLGIFSGFNIPPPISSSTASSGCLTLSFTSNGSFTNTGFEANVSCVTCQEPIDVPTGLCDDAQPFCTEVQGGLTFPAATNTQSEFGGGICCLGSTPNPAWYFMRIEDSGPIDILITSGFDVDFICWGPFTETQWQNGICGEVLDPSQNCAPGGGSFYVDCSYSAAAVENCNIPNAVAGEYYVLLLTNFSNQVTNINFQQNGGTGTTDCSIFCDIEVPVNPTACDPATNTFIMAGQIALTNPPATGTLTIANTLGGFEVFNAPFPPTVDFNFINLASNGATGEISVVFSDDNTCAVVQQYTAPQSCSTCPVTASTSGPACIGQNVSLTATFIQDATYSWTGPNGFTSTDQNPVLTNVDLSMEGVYTVTASNPLNGCQSIATTNVFVFPTPASPILGSNGPICEGTVLNLTASLTPGGAYNWNGPNAFASTLQNPSIAAASAAANGQYSCTVTVNTCPSLPATIDVVVNPYPTTPTPTNNGPLCEGDLLQLNTPDVVGATFEWTNPAGLVISNAFSPQIPNTTVANSGNYSVRLQLNGCWSLPATTAVQVFPIPTTPVLTANLPICQGSNLNLNGPSPLPVVGTVYDWSGPNGFSSVVEDPQVLAVDASASGTYTLVITENGCVSAPGTIDISVIPSPISNAGPDVTTCSNQPVQIGSAPTPGYTYSWSPIEGLNFANISNPQLAVSNLSDAQRFETYIVTTTDQICSTQDTVLVTINPQPIANFEAPAPMCFEGNTFDFFASGQYGAGATFNWNFGPFASLPQSTDEDPQDVSFNSTGLINVSLTITENGCESNVFQLPVQVYPQPVANFDASAYTACAPAIINFTNLTESEDQIKTIAWDFGNDRQSNLLNPINQYNDPGNYTVSLTITTVHGCVNEYRVNDMLQLFPSPIAAFNLEPNLLDIVSPYSKLTNFATNATEIVYAIPGLDTIFTSNATITYPDSGRYLITQIARNEFGCIDSLTKEAIVQIGYKLYVPTSFTPNNDGYNDFFRAYGEDIIDYSIEIYNRWGELMYTSFDIENGWDGTTRLSSTVSPGGVYLYRIKAVDRNGSRNTYEGTLTLLR